MIRFLRAWWAWRRCDRRHEWMRAMDALGARRTGPPRSLP